MCVVSTVSMFCSIARRYCWQFPVKTVFKRRFRSCVLENTTKGVERHEEKNERGQYRETNIIVFDLTTRNAARSLFCPPFPR